MRRIHSLPIQPPPQRHSRAAARPSSASSACMRPVPFPTPPPQSALKMPKTYGRRRRLGTNPPVCDASPAAFISHVPNRRNFSAILARYLELEPDLLLGGGKEQFLPKSQPGSRRNDEIDLIAAFVKK